MFEEKTRKSTKQTNHCWNWHDVCNTNFINYNLLIMTKNELRDQVKEMIQMDIEDAMNYEFVDGYDDIDEVIETVQEKLYHSIDNACIYYSDQKEIIRTLEMDHFGHSETTGERYTSEGEMAFEGLYELSHEFDIEEMITEYKKA